VPVTVIYQLEYQTPGGETLKLNRIVILLSSLLLTMTVTSCENEVNVIWPEEIGHVEVSITITTEYTHDRDGFIYPGEKITFDSQGTGTERVYDNTKTVIWTFTQISNGENYLDTVSTDGGVTSVEKVFYDEGTYNVRAELYNTEDYETLGVGSPLIDTDEREITVEAIDFEIETVVLDEKMIQFQPKILNPEIGPVYTGICMHFGDSNIEVSEATSLDSITHSYETDGIYDVIVELLYQSSNSRAVIATSDTSVRVKGDLYIVSPSGPLETDTVYTFQAHQVKLLPSASAYEWDFGDGTVVKIPYTSEVSHLFTQSGSYVVSVNVLDSEVMGENILTSTYLPVEVVESTNFLSELHETNKFDLDFSVQHDYTDLKTGVFIWNWDSYGDVTWDGTHFSMEWSQDRHSEYMIGRVSEDGTIIEHLIIRHEFVESDRAQTIQWYELVIHDLPFLFDEAPNKFTATRRGEELNYFVTYFNTYKTEGYYWAKDSELHIQFEKE
jgi:hypothetical protein